jgi:2-keto-4-pentenoate hydratase
LIGALMVGAELAGSPLPRINDLGPAVVVSDFGNNAGLILGAVVPDWRHRLGDAERDLHCATEIDGEIVGRGHASDIAGGLVAALRFALSRCAKRGMSLRAGQYVSTGAATGIHDIRAGQSARVIFDGIDTIELVVVRAMPRTSE